MTRRRSSWSRFIRSKRMTGASVTERRCRPPPQRSPVYTGEGVGSGGCRRVGAGTPDRPSLRGSVVGFGRLISIAAVSVFLFGVPAHAHGFGQRYDLPLPLSLYLFGTAAAVVVSFVIVGLFFRHAPGERGYPRIELVAPGSRAARAIGVAFKTAAAGLSR